MPEEQVRLMEQNFGRSAVLMDGIPFPFFGYPLEKITTVINVRDQLQAKLNGIRCHASQVDPALPYLQDDFDWETNPSFWQETFILARCAPGIVANMPTHKKEDDLFAGLR